MSLRDGQRELRQNMEQMSRVTMASRHWTLPGVVRDVSRSGIELTLGESVDPGTTLKIEMPGVTAEVKVTYCRPDGINRYRVGALTLDVRGSLTPQHLEYDLMGFYALGQGLVPSESFQVQAHLKICDACRQVVKAMETRMLLSPAAAGLRPTVSAVPSSLDR
jgi:hypothetical protein